MPTPPASDTTATLRTSYAGADDRVIAVNPDVPLLRCLVDVLPGTNRSISTDLLIADGVHRSLTDDFAVATRVAEYTARGRTRLASLSEPPRSRLVLSERRATAFVRLDDHLPLHSTVSAVTNALFDYYAGLADDAPKLDLDTPGRTELLETAGEHLVTGFRADLEAALHRSESAARGVDAVVLCLLLAAKHEVLLYDLSRWAEDIDLKSKASISRTKATLEDRDLVRTEKVPIDVGRPRQRLLPGPEWDDEDTDLTDFVTVASGRR